jgi:hypothetical protein
MVLVVNLVRDKVVSIVGPFCVCGFLFRSSFLQLHAVVNARAEVNWRKSRLGLCF